MTHDQDYKEPKKVYIFRAILAGDENSLRITCPIPGFGTALGNAIDVFPVRPGGHDVDLTIASGKSLATPAFSGSDSNLDKEFLETWTILIDHVILTRAARARSNFIVLIV